MKCSKCEKCGEERLVLRDGICFYCIKSDLITGKEIKEKRFNHKGGIEIKSKTGKLDENKWMSKRLKT